MQWLTTVTGWIFCRHTNLLPSRLRGPQGVWHFWKGQQQPPLWGFALPTTFWCTGPAFFALLFMYQTLSKYKSVSPNTAVSKSLRVTTSWGFGCRCLFSWRHSNCPKICQELCLSRAVLFPWSLLAIDLGTRIQLGKYETIVKGLTSETRTELSSTFPFSHRGSSLSPWWEEACWTWPTALLDVSTSPVKSNRPMAVRPGPMHGILCNYFCGEIKWPGIWDICWKKDSLGVHTAQLVAPCRLLKPQPGTASQVWLGTEKNTVQLASKRYQSYRVLPC